MEQRIEYISIIFGNTSSIEYTWMLCKMSEERKGGRVRKMESTIQKNICMIRGSVRIESLLCQSICIGTLLKYKIYLDVICDTESNEHEY